MSDVGPEDLCPICWKTDKEQAIIVQSLQRQLQDQKEISRLLAQMVMERDKRLQQVAELAVKRQWKIEELEDERLK